MTKCDFNKADLHLHRNRTSAWVFSCKFSAYFQNTFLSEQIWRAAFGKLCNTFNRNPVKLATQ